MTASVHCLLHLPQAVVNLGPLWSHSCFPFEAANGDMLKLFHGSQAIEKQVQQRSIIKFSLLASIFHLRLQVT